MDVLENSGAAPAEPWTEHTETVIAACGVDPAQGLTEAQARRRAAAHGPNRLHRREPVSAWIVLLKQFRSLIVGILAAAAILAFAFGEVLESMAIVVVIILNTAIGFVTELRAVRSMEALFALGTVNTRVRREGRVKEVSAEQLVPGDIVILEGGDVVTADLRVFECSKLQADESALTGESLPVRKQSDPLQSRTTLAERSNMLYKGTSITRGSGSGIVVRTGMTTELGSITDLVSTAEKSATPLEQRLDRLGRKLIWLTLAVGVLVIGVGVVSGQNLMLMVQTGLALAVAAIPEGLPVVATIALARGMQLMARRNALINRLASVETLGATRVICVDKTGTLTENRMTVTSILLPSGALERQSGEEGEAWLAENSEIDKSQNSELQSALKNAVLCNNAELVEPAGKLPVDGDTDLSESQRSLQGTGDPLEMALLMAGRETGLESPELNEAWSRVREVAFDPETRLMATFHQAPDELRVAVKGAPEAVLEHCTMELRQGETRPMDQACRQRWHEANESMAATGLRVLAIAGKSAQSVQESPYENLAFQALVGLFDPPRRDVGEAISQCHDAGIGIVMVTGDQAATALEVARAVGIVSREDEEVVCGTEIRPAHLLSESERRRFLKCRIFARVNPAQKLDIIALHQECGNTIAMTGDGVNDAPALKKADIGIAMGQRGTQVAREAADMVLQDDSFSTIVAAVHQGRVIFANIRAFVLYLISCNVSEVMVVSLAVMFSTQLPILPLQILFLNLVTDVFPALALGFSPGERGTMRRPPRPPGESILTTQHWFRILLYGLIFTVAVLGSLQLAQGILGASPEEAVTISFLTLAFAQLWIVFNMRNDQAHPLFNSITRNHWVWAALALCILLLLVAVYVPPLAAALDIHAPSRQGWVLILVMSLIPFVFGLVIKRVVKVIESDHSQSGSSIVRTVA